MIKIEIPSFRIEKPFLIEKYKYSSTPDIKSSAEHTIEVEMARRQSIVNKMLEEAHDIGIKVGSRIKFTLDSPEGIYRVIYFVKLAHLLKNEWPASDNPLLVSLQKEDKPEEIIHATTNKIGIVL